MEPTRIIRRGSGTRGGVTPFPRFRERWDGHVLGAYGGDDLQGLEAFARSGLWLLLFALCSLRLLGFGTAQSGILLKDEGSIAR